MFMFNHYINFHVSASNIAPAILIQHNIGFSSFKKRESGVSRECDMITSPEAVRGALPLLRALCDYESGGIVEGKGSRSASSRNVETHSHAVCVHQMMVF